LLRLFTTFPGGGRAVGLLLLRLAVGIAAIFQAGACLAVSSHAAFGTSLAGLMAMVSGVALLVGFLTPLASGLVTLGAIAMALSWFPLSVPANFGTQSSASTIAVVAASIILLGPGSLSFDARLFGRREIIIPPPIRSSRP
jgi:hypothetical protein